MNPVDITIQLRKKASRASLLDHSIIYEVNLSVSIEKADDYLQYLEAFTRQVCDNTPGFTNALVYSQPKPEGLHWLSEEGNSKSYFTVHYHVASQQDLQNYLERVQPEISHKDQDKWQFLVTSRRILRLRMSTFDS